MMRDRSFLFGSLVALCAVVAMESRAEERPADNAESTASVAPEQDIAESLKKLVFVPHDSGAPRVTDAGGVRAISILPKVELLAPDRMARTLSPSPTLYWHISGAAPGSVRFTLLADDVAVIDPLLEFDVAGINQEGIYGINLDDYDVVLDDGQRYIWSIAVSSDSDSYGRDMVAQTVMQHRAAPNLAIALNLHRPEDRAVRLAAEGYWYDAVNVLSDQIETSNAPHWQDARARLLDQAGLLHAARFDRQNFTN